MLKEASRRIRFVFPLTVLLVSTGCGGEGADKKAAVETQEATTSAPASVASGPVPDACTFYSKSELESAVGWQLDDGDVEDAEPGALRLQDAASDVGDDNFSKSSPPAVCPLQLHDGEHPPRQTEELR
ncbi:MAG: hypothetical protein H0W53_22175 [Acidobacteria bacterium]|nr:hypothetical protein [Acidobacteriota bacterium]